MPRPQGDGREILPLQDGKSPAYQYGQGGAQHDDPNERRGLSQIQDLHDCGTTPTPKPFRCILLLTEIYNVLQYRSAGVLDSTFSGTEPYLHFASALHILIDFIAGEQVDTGWINDEKPLEKAGAHAERGFQTPLDEVDAAAR